MAEPRIIEGGVSVDSRGSVRYANSFDMLPVKRYYTVSNHRAGFVRAWHAHKMEAKWFTAIIGVISVGLVKIDNWTTPSSQSKVLKYTLSEHNPNVLYIPPGYANGYKTVTDDALLLVFSDKTLAESEGDDYRYGWDYWNIWKGGRT